MISLKQIQDRGVSDYETLQQYILDTWDAKFWRERQFENMEMIEVLGVSNKGGREVFFKVPLVGMEMFSLIDIDVRKDGIFYCMETESLTSVEVEYIEINALDACEMFSQQLLNAVEQSFGPIEKMWQKIKDSDGKLEVKASITQTEKWGCWA